MALDLIDPNAPQEHVVFAATSLTRAKQLATAVTEVEFTDDGDDSAIARIPWTIRNKYYTADVTVVAVSTVEALTSIWHRVDAFIYVLDSAQKETVEEALEPFLAAAEAAGATPEIMMVCRIDAPPTTSEQMDSGGRAFCIAHSLEYCPVGGEEDRVEDDGEQLGKFRVREALHANMWSTLVMNPRDRPGGLAVTGPAEDEDAIEVTEEVPGGERVLSGMAQQLVDGLALDKLNMVGDDDDDVDVTKLFMGLRGLKESLATLSNNDRHDVAEHVATALLAMGGIDESD